MISTSTANLTHCQHCGNYHTGQCPRVKAIEYYANGTVKRIEFFGHGDYSAPITAPPIYPTQPWVKTPFPSPFTYGGTGSATSVIPSDSILVIN